MSPARLWLGLSFLFVTAILITYGLLPDPLMSASPATLIVDRPSVTANCGGVAVGGNVAGNTISGTCTSEQEPRPREGVGDGEKAQQQAELERKIMQRLEEERFRAAELARQLSDEAARMARAETRRPYQDRTPVLAAERAQIEAEIAARRREVEERQRASTRERQAIEQQLRSMNAEYKVPEQLMYKRSAQVVFVLEVEGNGTAANRLAAMPGQQESAQVSASRFVRARLSGAPEMVKITLRGGDAAERQFAQFKNVEWVWDVEGLKVGQVDLNLQLLAEIKIDSDSQPLQIKTFQKTIPIKISFFDTIKVYTDDVMSLWPFLAAVASAAGALMTFFGFKKPKAAKASA